MYFEKNEKSMERETTKEPRPKRTRHSPDNNDEILSENVIAFFNI